MSVSDEIKENSAVFQNNWWIDADKSWKVNEANLKFGDAYKFLAAINGVRENVAEGAGDKEFLLEAQNDGLASLVLCRTGMFRTSLQALRSLIESSLNGLYFKDHPVELARWRDGTFKTGFTELTKYFLAHPNIRELPMSLDPIGALTGEYGTLSKAVHGSAKSMWMSKNGTVNLAGHDAANIGAWATRFIKTSRSILILAVAIYKDKLTGAQHIPLRTTIGLSLTTAQRTSIKQSLNITFPHS